MYYDENALCNESTWDRTHMGLLKSTGITVFAPGISLSTRFLSFDPNDFVIGLNF